jgi:hypothetical protein
MQISASWIAAFRCSIDFDRCPWKSCSAISRWCLALRIASKASSMCGCGGIAAGATGAGTAAATGAGTAAVFGPAADTGKASVNNNVAVINSVKNPTFFMRSSIPNSGADAAGKIMATDLSSHEDARDSRPVYPRASPFPRPAS